MMRRSFAYAVTICVIVAIVITRSNAQRTQEQSTDPPHIAVNSIMQAKLEASQDLLRGLAMEDYELISRQTQKLELLSLDAGWNIVQTKDYTRISGEFREAARYMKSAAEKKNLDAVALGYVKLTMSCVDCHRHVRTTRAK